MKIIMIVFRKCNKNQLLHVLKIIICTLFSLLMHKMNTNKQTADQRTAQKIKEKKKEC